MKYEFSQVAIKSFRGAFQNGEPVLIVSWKAIFNKAVAKKLGVYDDLFKENGNDHSLRDFTEHGLSFFIDDASIALFQDVNQPALTFDGRLKKLAIVTDKVSSELTFQTQSRLDSAGLQAFMMNQGTEVAPKMVVHGKQLGLFDSEEPPPAADGPEQTEMKA